MCPNMTSAPVWEGLARGDLPTTDLWLDQCSTHACSPDLQSPCLRLKVDQVVMSLISAASSCVGWLTGGARSVGLVQAVAW